MQSWKPIEISTLRLNETQREQLEQKHYTLVDIEIGNGTSSCLLVKAITNKPTDNGYLINTSRLLEATFPDHPVVEDLIRNDEDPIVSVKLSSRQQDNVKRLGFCVFVDELNTRYLLRMTKYLNEKFDWAFTITILENL